MLNIEVQLCGLVFDLILIFFISRHESVGLKSEKIFRQCLIVYTTCVVLDISSIIAIGYRHILPALLVEGVCKLYLVSLVTSAYFAFAYTYNTVVHMRENVTFKMAVLILGFVGAALIMVTPISYYHEGRTVYTYGTSVVITYIFALLYIVSTLVTTFVYASLMNMHRRKAIRSWMALEIAAAIVQFFAPYALLVGFGSSLGLFILYSELENPEVYLDRTAGCFSFETFAMYLRQEFENLKKFSCVIVCNESEIKKSDEEQKKIIVEMAEFLNSFGFAKLFRLNDNDFALVYDMGQREMNEIESAVNLDVIRQRFKSKWGENSILNTKFLYIPDGHIVSSAEEFIKVYERNRYKFDKGEDMRTLDETAGQDIKEYRAMVLEIKDALRTDRVEVFYQPIYSVETGKFVSAEALARIRGNDGKLIMPGRFIPVAEESGLIGEIGERVFSKTCRCIKENNLKMKGIDYVEVNLSVSQCENPMLSSTYHEIMRLEEVRPKEINLEITESSTLNQRNILLENMKQLMNMGCGFSLDDFGTGESNLNYIVDMPVNIVKFDRSMVQDYFTNKRAEIVMRATVGMIKDLGLKIVAEGVETEEQVEGIKKLGIDYIQGYYYSKPLSKSDFIRFIETKNAS
ncbi:EAL domain, c-di-GMP-specific phosphodiesterase class I (or its enzymatically inactive variant) [Lachnospiraceae bacterium NE2001]|nr:EAL domain, c-di-GMP-specific phosphodiesterase class I (or its enzymatically inactive variant) [Lachnospiraceae bacterium NE2001]